MEDLGHFCGRRVRHISLSSDTDSTEILGCFEQADPDRKLSSLVSSLLRLSTQAVQYAGADVLSGRGGRGEGLAEVVWKRMRSLEEVVEREESEVESGNQGGNALGSSRDQYNALILRNVRHCHTSITVTLLICS